MSAAALTPTDLGQTREAVATFLQRYNAERPNQARTCQNQPPQVAFLDLPTLPGVPEQVDPDGWLAQVDGLQVTRRAGKDGRISVDNHAYYVGVAYQGQRVGVRVDAAAAELVITHAGQEVKRVALKGLQRTGPRPFAVWLEHLRHEAVAEQRRQRPRRGSGTGTRATASWIATLHEAANRVQDAEARPAADTEWARLTSPEAQRLADELGAIPF